MRAPIIQDLVDALARDGFVLLDGLQPPERVTALRVALDSALEAPEAHGGVFETDEGTVRAVHGCQRRYGAFAELCADPLFVELAETYLREPAYLYQFKVNAKEPGPASRWPWHLDFPFWYFDDGMPLPRAVTVGLFLDDVDARNGPLTFLEGSNRWFGVREVQRRWGSLHANAADWEADFSSDLRYRLSEQEIVAALARFRSTPVTGPAGTAFMFESTAVHGSEANLSTDRRAIAYLTYNACSNAPDRSSLARPAFLVERDTRPVAVAFSEGLKGPAES